MREAFCDCESEKIDFPRSGRAEASTKRCEKAAETKKKCFRYETEEDGNGIKNTRARALLPFIRSSEGKILFSQAERAFSSAFSFRKKARFVWNAVLRQSFNSTRVGRAAHKSVEKTDCEGRKARLEFIVLM